MRVFRMIALLACVFGPVTTSSADADEETCSLRLQFADAETRIVVPGLVQFADAEGKRIHIPQLLDRGLGLPDDAPIHDWFVLPRPTVVKVPQGKLTLRGFSGLETEMAEAELDLTGQTESSYRLVLNRIPAAGNVDWAGNTHVHMKKTTRPETDRYLTECSKADGLDVVFVSYLERPSPEDWLASLAAGKSFITNGPLLEFTVDGRTLGEAVSLEEPGKIRILGRAAGRVDFGQLELVQNGKVVQQVKSQPSGGHFVATMDVAVAIEELAELQDAFRAWKTSLRSSKPG